jgi:hypothetical protein
MPDTSAAPIDAAPDWRRDLPPDLREHPALRPLGDVAALAREHVNAQSLIGRKGVIPPGEKDGPEAWSRFYAQLGRPDAPDGYALPAPEGFEGYDADFAGWFRQAAHGAGLTPRQAGALHDAYLKLAQSRGVESATAEEQRGAEAERELRHDWGRGFDRNLSLARRAAQVFGDEEMITAVGDRFGEPALVRLFARIGEHMAEDRLAGTGSGHGTGGFGIDAGGARREIEKIQGAAFRDGRHPLMDATHPEHDGLVERLRQLYRVAHPG